MLQLQPEGSTLHDLRCYVSTLQLFRQSKLTGHRLAWLQLVELRLQIYFRYDSKYQLAFEVTHLLNSVVLQ